MPGIFKGLCKKLGINTDVVTVKPPGIPDVNEWCGWEDDRYKDLVIGEEVIDGEVYTTIDKKKEYEMEEVKVRGFRRKSPLTGAYVPVTMRHEDAWELLFARQKEISDKVDRLLAIEAAREVVDE